MFGTLYPSGDLVSVTFALATIAMIAAAALVFLGLSWTNDRWRVPLALSGAALLASALSFYDAGRVWLAGGGSSAAMRYVGWFVVHPMLVAAAYFLVRAVGRVPVGVFWRITFAAILMVLSRFLGDARIFDPTLGALLSVAFWLYFLGEFYFGAMAEVMRTAHRPERLGFFWIRLIFTIGWAIYPLMHFVDVVIGAGQAPGVVVIYSLADLVNVLTVALIVLAVSSQQRV